LNEIKAVSDGTRHPDDGVAGRPNQGMSPESQLLLPC
jgi:hypothetical protein